MKFISILVLFFLLLSTFTGCSTPNSREQQPQPQPSPSSPKETVPTQTMPAITPSVSPLNGNTDTEKKNPYPTVYQPLDFMDKSKLDMKNNTYINLLLAPIGWSKDGKFAYITGIDGGGAGNEETGFFRWIIQDMVSDKVLWVSERGLEEGLHKELTNPRNEGLLFTNDSEGLFSYNEKEILKWVFKNLGVKYKKYLDRYGITPDTNLTVSKFPLRYKNSEYTGFITDISYEEKFEIPNIISQYKVNVSKNGVRKTISQYNNENDLFLDVQIGGYIKSPYEPRIALLACNVRRGWEGPPHPVEFSFTGCHLEKEY